MEVPMVGSRNRGHLPHWLLLGLGAMATIGVTGCQVDYGGQTMPSPYYMYDDVQYFPPGPQMKLAREAAALKTYNQEQAAMQAPQR
jgi:hypothetical protein